MYTEHDDRDREGDRRHDRTRRPRRKPRARAVPTSCAPGGGGDDGLEDDDRTVDEEAEVDRAEAHEVTGHLEEVHAEGAMAIDAGMPIATPSRTAHRPSMTASTIGHDEEPSARFVPTVVSVRPTKSARS